MKTHPYYIHFIFIHTTIDMKIQNSSLFHRIIQWQSSVQIHSNFFYPISYPDFLALRLFFRGISIKHLQTEPQQQHT